MRKSFVKVLCCITAALLSLQVFTFGVFARDADITNDDYQEKYTAEKDATKYETIKDEHGRDKVVIKRSEADSGGLLSSGRKLAVSGISRMDLGNFVTLKIPETYVYSVELNYKYYNSDSDYYYNTYRKFAQYKETDATQTTITLGEFDWTVTDNYFIVVDTEHGVYSVNITQADLTRTINLSMDSTYTTAGIKVPFDLSTYDYYALSFLLYDEQGEYITNYYMSIYDIENGYKIPSGHYRVQVFGEGKANSFNFIKKDYYLTPSTKNITFSSSDMSKVSFNQTAGNSSGSSATIYESVFLHDDFDVTYTVAPSYSNGVPYVYVTKSDFDDVILRALMNDGPSWIYDLHKADLNTSAGPLTVNYDLNLKTQFNKPGYDIYGRTSMGEFGIINSNGQDVTIYNPDRYSNNMLINLSRGSESYDIYSDYGYISLPNPISSGSFTVRFSALGPLAVKPLTDTIYINRSSTLPDDARVYYGTPVALNAGASSKINMVAINTGTNVWNATGKYKLGAVGGSDPFTPAVSFPIPADVNLKENYGYVFEIPVTAPQTRGIYVTDWQMMKGTTSFGETAESEIIVRSVENPYKAKPISITSIEPDKASPQLTGTKIRWTCKITGGTNPVYYFKIFKGSTLVKSSTAYISANYFDWTPTEAGTNYRALVYVKENGSASSTAVTKYSSYYTITAPTPIVIKSLVPNKTSPQMTGTAIRWTCSITGGSHPVYYFKIFKGSTLVKSSPSYTAANYFDWTPAEAGTDYRAMVYVKENGSASSTAVTKSSSYFTVTAPAPIVIKSLVSDKASPQLVGTTIRWTCNITGGTNPVYYFKIFNGSNLVKSSTAYSSTNYFDWTPTEKGTDYRAYVYVKENGAATSTAVTKVSGYYIITTPAPIEIASLEPDKASPQTVGTPVRWTCSITGGSNPVYSFKVFNGSILVKSSPAFSTANYIDWTPTEAGDTYRVMVYVKENGAATSTAVTKVSGYYTVTVPAPIEITSLEPDKASPQAVGTTIRWTCNVTGGSSQVYYFKVFNGSTLVQTSTAFSAANYIDWTPAEAGDKYRVMVYAKENGADTSTAVTKVSDYYTVN